MHIAFNENREFTTNDIRKVKIINAKVVKIADIDENEKQATNENMVVSNTSKTSSPPLPSSFPLLRLGCLRLVVIRARSVSRPRQSNL